MVLHPAQYFHCSSNVKFSAITRRLRDHKSHAPLTHPRLQQSLTAPERQCINPESDPSHAILQKSKYIPHPSISCPILPSDPKSNLAISFLLHHPSPKPLLQPIPSHLLNTLPPFIIQARNPLPSSLPAPGGFPPTISHHTTAQGPRARIEEESACLSSWYVNRVSNPQASNHHLYSRKISSDHALDLAHPPFKAEWFFRPEASAPNSIPVFKHTPHFVIPYRFLRTGAVSSISS
jgi:hypothetical protein